MRLILLFLIGCAPALAVQEYYSISRSTRALGMGGAFHALSDDGHALFYNPAGLARYSGPSRWKVLGVQATVSTGISDAVSTVTDAVSAGGDAGAIAARLEAIQGKPMHLGLGIAPSFTATGFGVTLLLADVKANAGLLGRDLASSLDCTAISDTGVLIGAAFPLARDRFFAGFTLKGIARAGGHRSYGVAELASGASVGSGVPLGGGVGIDGDLGFSWEIRRWGSGASWGLGATLQNLVGSSFPLGRTGAAPPALARSASVGAYSLVSWSRRMPRASLRAEVADLPVGGQPPADEGGRGGALLKHLNLGVEVPLGDWLAARLGLYRGAWTAGLGLGSGFFRLELATYAEELLGAPGRLSQRRFALELSLGFLPAGDSKRKS